MTLWFWLIFVTLLGGCIGSFLNVVILRLPAGKSLVSPGSACPRCGHTLAWFENVPVVSWLVLRGRCRSCHASISWQYPLIEALTALLFGGLFVWYYMTGYRPILFDASLAGSWPIFAMHLVLVAGLLAGTSIDLRYYIIPVAIPWLVTVLVLVGYPLATALDAMPPIVAQGRSPMWMDQVVPVASHRGLGAAMGGVVGLAGALALVLMNVLPRSFDDMDELEQDEPANSPEQMIAHPHPRREALKEALFLLLPIAGMVVGWVFVPAWIGAGPPAVRVLGGVALGYLIGGGLVWLTRVLGTLAFGKEAMGLGDVHLLAAIGAVIGGVDAVFVFFIAPFIGLALALGEALVTLMKKAAPRVIPFGPSLAAATLIMLLGREWIMSYFFLP